MLFGPKVIPRAVPMYRRLLSPDIPSALGYQPVGMNPITCDCPRSWISTTATLLLSALATKSLSPDSASAIGVEPMGALGSRDVRIDSVTFGASETASITLTVFVPALVTKIRPSGDQRTSLG